MKGSRIFLGLNNAVVTVTQEGDVKEKFVIDLPNVRKLQGFLKGFWDFNVYQSAFPGRSKFSDVDGSIELYGHTLHVEFKESRYGMTQGQVLKAIRQAKHSNITTVFVFGKTNKPVLQLVFSPEYPEGLEYEESSVEILTKTFADWAKWAKDHDLVTDRTEEWAVARRYC